MKSEGEAAEFANGGSGKLNIWRIVIVAIATIPIFIKDLLDWSISSYYYRAQDFAVLLALLLALFLMTYRVPTWRLPEISVRARYLVLTVVLLVLAAYWGTYAVLKNYPLTRDEHMVIFDMAVFSQGRLLQPLAPEWRPFAQALVPAFLLDVPHMQAWASAYLPGNALMRLGFSKLLDPALMNPLLAGASVLALFDIVRRLLPDDNRAAFVALLLYVGSLQVWVNAMTVYAMTAHTALNMIWLMLFLRDRPWAHAVALIISAWAIGLHQVVFHPLFAGPFLLWRLSQRRYGLFAIYAAWFSAALLFWMLYTRLAVGSSGIVASSGAGDPLYFWRERVLPLLLHRDPTAVLAMTLNVIRHTTWQHLALIPLAGAALPLARRNVGIALPLAAGVGLTLAFCTLMLPHQGHGWGYRYLAGVLGNMVTLGGIGYHHWAKRDRRTADGIVAGLSLLTLVSCVFLLVRVQQFVEPYASLDKVVGSAQSDMVLIDTEAPSMAIDQARNLPDLSNRPLRLSSRDIDIAGLRELCRRGSISLIERADMHRVGFGLQVPASSPEFERKIESALKGKACLLRRE